MQRIRFAAGILLAALFLGKAIAAEGPGYTLEDLSKRPGLTGYQPSNLRWQPEGELLAYLLRDPETDKASLYLADPAKGTTEMLLDADTLAGAARDTSDIKNEQAREWAARYNVSTYRWSPQGDGITFISDSQMYFYDLESEKLARVTQAAGDKQDMRMSPDQQWIAFVQDNTLRYVRRDGGPVGEVATPKEHFLTGWPTWVYAEELDVREAYEWSPDSRKLAFMEFNEEPVEEFPLVNYIDMPAKLTLMKYPKAGAKNPVVRMGLHDVASGKTVYASVAGTPDTYLARIGWLPDGSKAYAIVVNREQDEMRLYYVDPDSGESQEILEIEDDAWVDVTNDFHFLEDGRFVFGHQEDGWHHLYLYDRDGDEIEELTDGDYTVYKLHAVDEENGWVYFSRYTDGPRNIKLFRVSLDGGTPQPITPEPGVHGIEMDDAGRYFVDKYSTSTAPTGQWLKTIGGETVMTLAEPADLSAFDLQPPEFRTLMAADGETELLAQMIFPPDFDPSKKYPVIMSHYGGPGVGPLVKDSWGGTKYFMNNLLAHDGYILFKVDNRAAGNFAHEQQAVINHRLGKIELEDQLAAVQWLKSQPWTDADNIGLVGHSYGGYMTIYALEKAPGVWKAGIAGAPVTQWQDYDTIYTERYMSTPQKNPEGYKQSSTLTHADGLADPLLLIHGTGDDNVHWQNTAHLIDALVKANKHYELLVYPNKTHSLRGEETKLHLYTQEREFWRRHLGR